MAVQRPYGLSVQSSQCNSLWIGKLITRNNAPAFSAQLYSLPEVVDCNQEMVAAPFRVGTH